MTRHVGLVLNRARGNHGRTDGLTGLEVAAESRPDVVVDIGLPTGPDGLAAAPRLRERHEVGLLMVTAAREVDQRVTGFHVGADDYVGKPFDLAEVLARIHALLRGFGSEHRDLSQGRVRVDVGSRTVWYADTRVNVTPPDPIRTVHGHGYRLEGR